MIVLAAFALVATQASAEATAPATASPSADAKADVQTEVKAEKPSPMPMHVSAGLTHSMGSATYVLTPPNPTLASTLTLAPSLVWHDWNISITERISLEWTRSDSTTYANQLEPSDPALRVGWSGLKMPDLGLGFSFAGGYNAPLSLYSRNSGSLGGLAASARGAWSSDFGLSAYGGLSAGYNLLVPSLAGRLAKDAPVRPYQDRSAGEIQPLGCTVRSDVEYQNYGCGGVGGQIFGWGPALGVAYTMLDGRLSFALDLGYRMGFGNYIGPDDQFTADRARTGLVPRHSTSSNLGVSYSPVEWFSLSGGMSSGQGLYGADGTTLRFPIWDFVSPANNLSSFYVDTTFSI